MTDRPRSELRSGEQDSSVRGRFPSSGRLTDRCAKEVKSFKSRLGGTPGVCDGRGPPGPCVHARRRLRACHPARPAPIKYPWFFWGGKPTCCPFHTPDFSELSVQKPLDFKRFDMRWPWGPAAPARTARTAMTGMHGRGCRRLIWERGSSRVEKDSTISSSLLRVLTIADLRPPDRDHDTVDGIPGQTGGRKAAKFTKST